MKAMHKLPTLSIILSTACLWFLSSLPSLGSTQDEPVCYMINSSGQVMDLEALCEHGQNILAKSNACSGPFDQDGFPAVFSSQVQRLKGAIANARQRNAFLYRDEEVQSAIADLRNQMPFALQWQQRQALMQQLQTTTDPQARASIRQQLQSNISQLAADQCFRKFTQAQANLFYSRTTPTVNATPLR